MFELKRELRNANIPRTIRFTDDLFERLNELAQQNGVSFNNLVLQCCTYALNELEEDSEK
jgi:predicted DNA-binding protein